MKLKLLRKDACSKCGHPDARAEYEIIHEKNDLGTLRYCTVIKEKCSGCGRNYERLNP